MRLARGSLAFALGLALLAAPVAAQGPAGGAATDAVAVVVHLAGAPSPLLPATASELRAATLDLAAAILQSRGMTVTGRAATEELVRRHVVRSGVAFGPGFLADLARDAGAGVLLAVGVRTQGGRLAATARAIATADGTLLGIGFAEAEAAAGDDWRRTLTDALRHAMPEVAAPGEGPVLVVLPARAVGLDAETGGMATAALLAAVLADGRWRPLDSALVAGAAAAAGCDLERLDGRARKVLREGCGSDRVVVPEIVSFGESGRTDPWAEFAADGGGYRSDLAEFVFNLRLLDLRTGVVARTSSTHTGGGPVHGWFGRVHNPGEPARIRAAARQAWSRFHGFLKENAS